MRKLLIIFSCLAAVALGAEEPHFAIVITAYNVEDTVEKNLSSVFTQTYNNYHVYYVDDASTDGTFEKVREVTAAFGKQEQLTLIRNEKNRKQMHNFYTTISQLSNHEIVVELNGDDWFSKHNSLSILRDVYRNPSVWATHGRYRSYPDNKLIGRPAQVSAVIAGKIRQKWSFFALRSFYAGLFKRIKIGDLMFDGKFFMASADHPIMLAVAEMSRKHIHFVPEILYIADRASPLTDQKLRPEMQMKLENYSKLQTPYDALKSHPKLPHEIDYSCTITSSRLERVPTEWKLLYLSGGGFDTNKAIELITLTQADVFLYVDPLTEDSEYFSQIDDTHYVCEYGRVKKIIGLPKAMLFKAHKYESFHEIQDSDICIVKIH